MSRNLCSVLRAALTTGIVLAASSAAVSAGSPKKVSPKQILYYFQGGTDGGVPNSTVIADPSGNLYGTTEYGGTLNCMNAARPPHKPPPAGCGTVFKVAADGTETVLYSFGPPPDAANPQSGVTMDAQGNLYGTSPLGRTGDEGAVFKVTPGGVETILYDCQNRADGYLPYGTSVLDASGCLYDTTFEGGAYNVRTVFEIASGGSQSVLFSFRKKYGDEPNSGVTLDQSGDIYGTTTRGGNQKGDGDGVVFKLTP